MSLILPILLALSAVQATPTPAQRKDASALVDGVDRTFAKMRDFEADFVHKSQDSLNRKRQESGHLYLARDRRMKWVYNSPEEKLLYSNGKTVYWFEPAARQVHKDDIKNISDDQLPMMFLVGRAGLKDQFKQVDLLNDNVLRLTPKKKGYVRQIEVEVDPTTYWIRRMVLTYDDDARAEFIFSNIRTNIGLPPETFEFKTPPGVELIQGFDR
jgi:outer membrane lipoprotein carrier protein